jgi:hypothetical protein
VLDTILLLAAALVCEIPAGPGQLPQHDGNGCCGENGGEWIHARQLSRFRALGKTGEAVDFRPVLKEWEMADV